MCELMSELYRPQNLSGSMKRKLTGGFQTNYTTHTDRMIESVYGAPLGSTYLLVWCRCAECFASKLGKKNRATPRKFRFISVN